jgi:serine/threonine protein phosphatase PrpC
MNYVIIKKDNVVDKEGKVELLPPVIPETADTQKQLATEKPVELMKAEPAFKIIQHKKALPNCKITGIDYRVSLEKEIAEFVNLEEIKNICIPKIDSSPKFPITWNSDKYELSCHPDQAGEFAINMVVETVKHERHIFQFNLTVNPDPKTLWKNIPSKQDGVYPKPDCDKFFLACGKNLSIAAASQRGRSHAQEGKPRDDDFLVDWDAETNCAILAAADGAGSARFSRKGSQIAVKTALDKVKAALKPDFWTTLEASVKKQVENDIQAQKNIQVSLYKVLVQAAWEAKVQIREEVKEHEEAFFATYKKREQFTVRDYATTLILTIVKKLNVGGWFIATFWVGDGGMGVYRKDSDKVIVQGIPDGGDYGGQTRFLTEDSSEVWPQGDDAANKIIARRIRFDVVDSFDAVILMTDGITDPKFETDNNLNSQAKWNELWADMEKEVSFEKRNDSVADALLKWMDFWSPGNHDDRTIVILY